MASWVPALAALFTAFLVTSALVAIAAPKGGALHQRAGRAFHHAVLGSAFLLVPITLATGDAFLAIVSGLSAYLVLSGRREVLRQRRGEAPSAVDQGAVALLAFAGAGLLGLALLSPSEDGLAAATPFFAGVGALILYVAWTEYRRLSRPPDASNAWLVQHVGAMGVATMMLTTTASVLFLEDVGLPSWLVWLGPVLVGLPSLLRWLAVAREQGPSGRFL